MLIWYTLKHLDQFMLASASCIPAIALLTECWLGRWSIDAEMPFYTRICFKRAYLVRGESISTILKDRRLSPYWTPRQFWFWVFPTIDRPVKLIILFNQSDTWAEMVTVLVCSFGQIWRVKTPQGVPQNSWGKIVCDKVGYNKSPWLSFRIHLCSRVGNGGKPPFITC